MVANHQPLAGLRVALAGPGRVGTSLAWWARAAGATLVAVAGRPAGAGGTGPATGKDGPGASTTALAAALGARAETVATLSSDDCDLLLVAVADDALDAVAAELARRPQAPVALHTAGSRGASALDPLASPSTRAGAAGVAGSFHPLKAFPAPLTDPGEAAGTFFALDGPPAALAMGRRLAEAFGGTAEVVPEQLRTLYHLAASVAAGGVATLVTAAADLARSLGLPDAVGRGYLTLGAGALAKLAAAAEAAEATGRPLVPALGAAITGPVARGDDATFVHQIEALRAVADPHGAAGTDRDRRALFTLLALETARLTGAPHDEGAERPAGHRRRQLEDALRNAGLAPLRAGRERPDEQA